MGFTAIPGTTHPSSTWPRETGHTQWPSTYTNKEGMSLYACIVLMSIRHVFLWSSFLPFAFTGSRWSFSTLLEWATEQQASALPWCPIGVSSPRSNETDLPGSNLLVLHKSRTTWPLHHPIPSSAGNLGFADPGHYYKLLHLQGLSQQHLSVSRIAPGLQFLHPTWESYEVHGGIDSSWYKIAWRKCVPMPGVEFSELMCLRQDPGMTCLILWWCHISPRNTQAARPRPPEARLLQPLP